MIYSPSPHTTTNLGPINVQISDLTVLYTLVLRISVCFWRKTVRWICLPSIGVMLNGLGVNFTAAHVFDSQRQPLSILDFSISHSFQIGLLYFTVFSPNDLSISVHGHGWLLTTDLQQRKKKGREKKNKTKQKTWYNWLQFLMFFTDI